MTPCALFSVGIRKTCLFLRTKEVDTIFKVGDFVYFVDNSHESRFYCSANPFLVFFRTDSWNLAIGVYRVKVTVRKGSFPYGNFDTIDTDGQIPRVGSEKYKEWVGAAIKSGFMRIVDKVDEIPDFKNGVNLFGSEEKAGFSDTYRKQCARCHVWGEGRNQRGDLRASGCASCHVLYGNDGKYEGNDPTIKNTETRPHPLRHRITTAIPSAQCTHCHTRGRRIGTTFVGM